MSDQEIRTAERTAVTSGSAEDEAKALAAQVRSGHLPRFKLQMAAYCAHPAALLALGLDAPKRNPLRAIVVEEDRPRLYKSEWKKWAGVEFAHFLQQSGAEQFMMSGVVAIVAAAREVVEQSVGDTTCRMVVNYGRLWLEPQDASRDAIAEQLRASREVVVRDASGYTRDAWWGWIISAVLWIRDGDGTCVRQGWGVLVADALQSAGDAVNDCESLKLAVRNALLKWALEGTPA